PRVVFVKESAGSLVSGGDAPVPSSNPAYLKIVKIGSRFDGYYSNTGISWQYVASWNTLLSTQLTGLFAASGTCTDSNAPLPVRFDYFSSRTVSVLRASLNSGGSQGNGDSLEAALSGNGQLIAFRSLANNLTPGD